MYVSLRQTALSITHQILYGDCFHDREPANQEGRAACKHVSSGFSTAQDLSDSVIDLLMQYKDNMWKLLPCRLLTIVAANDYLHFLSAQHAI